MAYSASKISEKAWYYLTKNTDQIILERGLDYFDKNKIIDVSFETATGRFKFLIKGTKPYQTTFAIDENNNITQSTCNCPYQHFCKHQAAAAYWLKEEKNELKELLENKKETIKPEPKQENISTHFTPRNSFTPFIIPVYRTLNPYQLAELYLAKNTGKSQIINYSLKKTDTNTYKGEASFKAALSWGFHNKNDTYNIILKHQSDGLAISCGCNVRITKLCSHAYALLVAMIKDGNLAHIQEKTEAETETIYQQVANNLGIAEDNNWRKHFQFSMANGEFGLKPSGKYENLMGTDILDELNFNEAMSLNPEEELQHKTETQKSDVYQLGFAFWFHPDTSDSFKITPLIATSGKKGLPMEVKFKEYKRNTYETIEFQYGDHALLDLCNKLEESYNGFHQHQINMQSERMHDYMEFLVSHPYLYFNKDLYGNQIKKSALQSIKFIPTTPQVSIEVTQEGNFIRQNTTILQGDERIALSDQVVQRKHEFFVLIKDHLYFFPNKSEISQWNALQLMQNKLFATSKFDEVFEKHLKFIGKSKPISFTNFNSLEMKKKKINAVQKELYLTELDNFVIFRPFVRFDDDTLIEAKTENANLTLSGNTITQKSFDEESTQSFLTLIENLHPKFQKQAMSSFYHLTYTEMMQNNAFLRIFRELSNEEIKVFGLKNLKKLKVNPHTGKVNYSVESGTDWFDVKGGIYFGDEYISLSDLKKKFIPGSAFVELSDGKNGIIPDEWLKKLESLFLHSETEKGELKLSKKHFSLVEILFEDLENEELLFEIAERKDKLLNFSHLNQYPIPQEVTATLRHYQEDGFQWLCFLDEFQWGGILADDMGLGKTLQVITFLSHILKQNKQTNLIVVPTSLLFNWENELKKFAPHLNAHFYYGSSRIKSTKPFDKYDIVFTSYGLMLSDIKSLKEYPFNYVILDESQAIKNTSSKRYKAARLLNANNRIAMTGTPIENNTFDLYAQMSFLNPGFLGSAKSFKDNYAHAIDKDRDNEKAKNLQQLIKPFVLRRTKQQVATELPDKIEDILYCEMDKEQRKIYDALRNDIKDRLLNKIEEEGLAKSRFSVLEGLTKLRLVCDTPEILTGDEKYGTSSAKLRVLADHIEENTPNHKILIFSQFVKMLKVIEKQIQDSGMKYAYLDGQSSQKERQDNVNKFQEEEDCRIFLISLKAGGTGLNLMAADYVYIVDPWWNPAVENQAIDRCYRIGQDKKVIAYRMICKDTIEEKIMELKSKKNAIAGDIINTDENTLKQLDKNDIMALFD